MTGIFYFESTMLFDTRKRHSQLSEAGLHWQYIVFAIFLLIFGSWRVLRMTNAFGSFGETKEQTSSKNWI